MLTKHEKQALAWAVASWARCLPPENRNATKNGTLQPAFDKLRLARGALKKLRTSGVQASEPLRHATKDNGDCPHWCKACAAEAAARGVALPRADQQEKS
jgi:hypothetical protein